jgi:hypothetical protein
MNSLSKYRNLIDVLPLHAEEGNLREELLLSEIISSVEANDASTANAEIFVSTIQRIFESLSLLDPTLLAKGRWAFVSFPASLFARSVLETFAMPEATFFDADYWIQGGHQLDSIAEEQRTFLSRMENHRTANSTYGARPIRTVHVTWGIIRFGSQFLLHRREDKLRPDKKGYVFPGGRLAIPDLPRAKQTPESLRDLFQINSDLAKNAQHNTLAREL